MKVIITIIFCCNNLNGKVKFMAVENSLIFLLHCGHRVVIPVVLLHC